MNDKESISISWMKQYLWKLYAERDAHSKQSLMWQAYNNSICVIQEMLTEAGFNVEPFE